MARFGVTEESLRPSAMHCLLPPSSGWAILLRWTRKTLPPHSQWLKDLVSCLKWKKIRHFADQRKTFYRAWGLFLAYFHNPDIMIEPKLVFVLALDFQNFMQAYSISSNPSPLTLFFILTVFNCLNFFFRISFSYIFMIWVFLTLSIYIYIYMYIYVYIYVCPHNP